MTVSVYKSVNGRREYIGPISSVTEPNAAQRHNGNAITVDAAWTYPLSIGIENDELYISITHKSAVNLVNEIINHDHMQLEILSALYKNERNRERWNMWEKT